MKEAFKSNHAVISLSGGLDSTCLLLKLLADGYEVRAYSFDYGQKHSVELEKVKNNIRFLQEKKLPVTHQVINLRDVFSDSMSSLHKGGEDIPHGMYDQENMKSTVVENRNIIFSSIIYGKALAWANLLKDNVIITQGLHAGDHCFTGDTKILTPEGYKTIDTIKVGDIVYSLDPETGAIIEDKCLDVINKGVNSTIYNIKTTSGTVRLTSEHDVYVVKYGDLDRSGFDKTVVKKKVKDLNVGDIMLTSCKLPNIKSSVDDTIDTTNVVKGFLNNIGYTLEEEDGIYSFQSKSKKLLEQVAFLAKLSGYYVKVTYGNNTSTITFASKCRKQGLVRYGDGAMTKITDIVIDESKLENVYDISIEKNHNFFAGDFGNILISNSIYPDCRPESQEMARELYRISNWGSERVDFVAPFINIDKGDVLKAGLDAMKVFGFTDSEVSSVLKNTHTCYDPNEKGESCGLCGSCTERIEAFAKNSMVDPAEYSLPPEALEKIYSEAYKRIGYI